ncbi:MAG: FapA family protein [Spirochaetaceae bacterium]|jgi:uncharacterized protein (DUF342 family)|nr:FapA family protein [Spirochaetaceae bacterium]
MNNTESHREGKFDLFYHNGYAEIIVYPPEGTGLPVYPEDIRSRMKILGITQVRLQKLIDIISEAGSHPVKLVEWSEGIFLSSHISISISENLISAEATISAPKPGGGDLSLKDVYDELERLGICNGINEKNINRMIADRSYDRAFLIASGVEPVQGRNSRVEYFFETERIKPFLEMEFGRINLKELNFIQNCNSGDLLAELKPAEPAVDGFNILGDRFPAESIGDPAVLKCGKNAHIKNNQVFADINGNVILKENSIEVEEVVTVNNVDYETGNIDFDGSVDIKGTIADGFTVKASGDIQIGKCIGRAKVISNRNVVLKAGINGDREGFLQCKGNLLTKYIESATISCGADIFAEEAIMNSQIDIVGSLFLSGRRAELIGGLSIVGGMIHCKKIGNLYGAKTNIILGIHPELIDQFFKAQKRLVTRRDKLDKLDEQLSQLKTIHHKDEESSKKVFQAISKVEEDIHNTSAEISRDIHELQHLKSELIPSEKSYILAEDRIFSGVKLSFGLQDHPVPDKGISSSVIYKKGRDIVEAGYNRVNPIMPEELS